VNVSPWWLPCPWCPYRILVGNRGARGSDPGAGVEAADLMERHVKDSHSKTWREFLAMPEADR
jgi:hypothetical protein